MKENGLSRVLCLEVWNVAFTMLDLGPPIAETKGKRVLLLGISRCGLYLYYEPFVPPNDNRSLG